MWEQTGDEFAALLRELELIQTLRPKFNVLGVPGLQRHHYICVGKSPAPYVFITNKPTGKELGVYGPLVVRDSSEDAARRLNDWFKLRDCPQTVPLAFADQPELFPEDRSAKCLRFELGTCRGPCAAACSRQGVRGRRAGGEGVPRRPRPHASCKAEADDGDGRRGVRVREGDGAARPAAMRCEWLDARLTLLRQARNEELVRLPADRATTAASGGT